MENNLKFNDEMIRHTRMIHLAKKVSFMKSIKREETEVEGRIEREFVAWGYFDYMTYNRFQEREVSFEHCFEIRYPYTNSSTKLVSDQYFTLLDDTGADDFKYDPFEYDSDSNENCVPFLGMYLISIEAVEKENFQEIVTFYKECICEMISEQYKDRQTNHTFLWKLFPSLNCADLCLVVRTNELQLFPDLRIALKKCVPDEKRNCHELIITPILFCEKIKNKVEQFYRVFSSPKNRKVKLNIRVGVSCNDSFEKELFALTSANKSRVVPENYVYDILGSGDYSVTLPTNDYFIVYEALCTQDSSALSTITNYPAAIVIAQRLRSGEAIMLHERFRFPKEHSCSAGYVDAGDSVSNCFGDKKKTIQNIMDQWRKDLAKERYEWPTSYQYIKNISLIKDLLYTYDDLWYQSKFTVRGYIFYVQMIVMMNGIEDYLMLIQDKTSDPATQRIIRENLLSNMHQSIICINNYSKLLQNLHQNQVNYPNYEIQTKVNAEKYFLAYTNFLFEICSEYFKEDISKGVKRFYPVATLDVTRDNIMTQMLFAECATENSEDHVAFYSVIFPDYPRFSNIFHVLPLLTHEISHFLRFERRMERNEAFISYMIKMMSEKLAENLLAVAENVANSSSLPSIRQQLAGVMAECFIEDFKNNRCVELCGENWQDLHLKILTKVLEDYFLYICYPVRRTDVSFAKSGENEKIVWGIVQKELGYLKIDVKDFKQLEERFSQIKMGSASAAEYSTFELQLLIEYFWYNSQKEKKEADARTQFYIEIKEYIETTATEEAKYLVDTVERLYGKMQLVMKEGKIANSIADRRLFESFFDSVFRREYYMAIREFDTLLKQLKYDSLYCNAVKNMADKLLDDNVQNFMESLGEFRSDVEAAIMKKTELNSKQKQLMCISLQSLAINLIDMRTRYQNAFKLMACWDDEVPTDKRTVLLKIRNELRNRIKKIYREKTMDYLYLASVSGNTLITNLGVNTSDEKYFIAQFDQAMKLDGVQGIKDRITDSSILYGEIYADLGMCAIFEFQAFGYLRFAIHIFAESSDEGQKLGRDLGSQRLIDVAMLLLMTENEKNYDDSEEEDEVVVARFWTNYNNLREKCESYRNIIVNKFNCWMTGIGFRTSYATCKEIVDNRKLLYEKVKSMEQQKKDIFHYYMGHAVTGVEIGKHIFADLKEEATRLLNSDYIWAMYKVYKSMERQTWIQTIRRKEPLSAIGSHYNNWNIRSFGGTVVNEDSPVFTNEKKMAMQVNFVQENYWRYKSRFMRLASESVIKEAENWLDIVKWPIQLMNEESKGGTNI